MAGDDVSPNWVIACLLEAGMWEEVAGGYRIHDFHDYQPTKEQVLHERDLNKKRVAEFRERNAISNAITNDISNGPVMDAPVPVSHSRRPEPLDVSKPTVSHPPQRGAYTQEFEVFWTSYPKGHGDKKPTYAAWKQVPESEREDVLAGLERWKGSQRWQQGIILAADQFLKRGRWREPIPEAQSSPNGREPEQRRPQPKPVDFDALRRAH
jgi:hypothetical protein